MNIAVSPDVVTYPDGLAALKSIDHVVQLDAETAKRCLQQSVHGLANDFPKLSAKRRLGRRQMFVLQIVLVAAIPTLLLEPTLAATAFIALAIVAYAGILGYRVRLFRRSLHSQILSISDGDARSIPDSELPRYTVLIPAYQEADVIGQAIGRVMALEYPADRLDVKILVEADDQATLDAIREAAPPECVSVVVLPDSGPRTKPKALNYGLCLATGDLVTIYDAEDHPEPLQLRRAAVAFSKLSLSVACLQASLFYYNKDQNILTRWFQGEYLTWFRFLLPGLSSRRVPVPLGGTSNHFRRLALEIAGGWDPYNVTEDADLGVRLHRFGYQCVVLDSVTYEEATSDYVNWARQRSRWHKGYMQTWLVHMRHPVELLRELGWRGFLAFNLFVGGTPLLALLNPIFWGLTAVWFVAQPPQIQAIFPAPVYYPALACWAVGNATVVYLNLLTVRLADDPPLAVAAVLSPFYWVIISISAYKALWQLIGDPVYWEKTVHGMTRVARTEPASVVG